MKKAVFILIGLILMNYNSIGCMALMNDGNNAATDSLKVLSTPGLYNLSQKLASEYKILFPESKIRVISVPDNKFADKLKEGGTLGFVSDDFYSGQQSESIRKIVVGRDVMVPVINSKNPYLDEIRNKGISPKNLKLFINNQDSRNWGTLLNGKQNVNAVFYYIDDNSIMSGLASFLKTDINNIDGIRVENPEQMLSAIQNDKYAIGFCRMISILDLKSQGIATDIALLPIDRNGNGVIDYNEKIYNDLNDFSRGVWIGKYPKELFSNIYSVSLDRPDDLTGMAFMKWVLSDGQQYLYSNGYTDLLLSERQTAVSKLNEAQSYVPASTNDKSIFRSILIILAVIVLAGFVVDMLGRYIRSKKTSEKIGIPVLQHAINENSMIVPKGLYFDKTHTWAFMEQNGVVKVGIDDFLQHVTGTLTRIIMKNEGDKIKKGDQILSIIQNGKQLNLYAPISGTIREKNIALNSNASIMNTSPYNEGWIYRIEPANWLRENQLLFMADKQKEYIKSEFSRLKDFLTATLLPDTEKYAQVILQDGGELSDRTLENMGPEVWEDFQTKFIDPSRQVWFYELF